MARSIKKGPYVFHKLVDKVIAAKESNKEKSYQNLVTIIYDCS